MTFEEWNDVLARRFFNPGQAGKRVYLHTTKELLVELSSSNTGVDDFIAVIKLGPAQIRNGEMCSRAIAVAKNWRASGVQYPPYIAYLCLFALAASHDGDWPRHAYYPRLWDILKEPNSGAPPHFRVMSLLLWRDLEVWSHSDAKGELGLFKFQSALDWIYIGLPIAQTILTDEERSAPPEIFERADLEPGSILPEGQMAGRKTPDSDRQNGRPRSCPVAPSVCRMILPTDVEMASLGIGRWLGARPSARTNPPLSPARQ